MTLIIKSTSFIHNGSAVHEGRLLLLFLMSCFFLTPPLLMQLVHNEVNSVAELLLLHGLLRLLRRYARVERLRDLVLRPLLSQEGQIGAAHTRVETAIARRADQLMRGMHVRALPQAL